jgi:hypothetical protein
MKKIALYIFCMCLLACGRDTAQPQDEVYCEIEGVAFQSARLQVQYSQAGSVTSLDIYAYNEKGEVLLIKVYAIGNALTTHYVEAQNQHNLAYSTTGNFNNASSTYQTKGNCIGNTGTYIQLTSLEDFLAFGTFDGKMCLPNGQVKTIRNGRFNQVRLP